MTPSSLQLKHTKATDIRLFFPMLIQAERCLVKIQNLSLSRALSYINSSPVVCTRLGTWYSKRIPPRNGEKYK